MNTYLRRNRITPIPVQKPPKTTFPRGRQGHQLISMNITLSSQKLRHAADLKDRIDALQADLSALFNGTSETTPLRRRGMSPAGRARIAAAQRARWARMKTGGNGAVTRKLRRRMSAAAKARLAAVARARWKKARAAGRNAL